MERWRECKLLQYFIAWNSEGPSRCISCKPTLRGLMESRGVERLPTAQTAKLCLQFGNTILGGLGANLGSLSAGLSS